MTEPPSYPPPPRYGAPPPYGSPYGPGPYPYPPPAQTNGMAVASLICAFVFAPLGIVFGHISLSQIKRTGEEGRGLAVAGLVISYLVTALTITPSLMASLGQGATAAFASSQPFGPATISIAMYPAGFPSASASPTS